MGDWISIPTMSWSTLYLILPEIWWVDGLDLAYATSHENLNHTAFIGVAIYAASIAMAVS